MAEIGYKRVSPPESDGNKQLSGVKLDKVFTDYTTDSSDSRPQFQAMCNYIREDDALHVESIDRICSNLSELQEIVDKVNKSGITIKFHRENLLFTGDDSPMQILMLSLLRSFAEFERSLKEENRILNEPPAPVEPPKEIKSRGRIVDSQAVYDAVVGGMSYRKAAEHFSIGLSTVQRIMRTRDMDGENEAITRATPKKRR